MKQLILSTLVFVSSSIYGQEIIYQNNFESIAGFQLNTQDLDANIDAQNSWVINDVFLGGSGSFTCSDMKVQFDVPAASQQPTGITNNPTSKYLHVTPKIAIDEGGTLPAASYVSYDGVCVLGNESSFAKMTSDFSTTGFENIEIDMWWMCGGSESYYGEVYYSLDEGRSWEILYCPATGTTSWNGVSAWEKVQIKEDQLTDQPSVRLGFRFVTGVEPDGTSDPGFAVDDITVSGYKIEADLVEDPIEESSNVLSFDSDAIGEEIIVYPNPTHGELFLDIPAAFDNIDVTIRNMEGKITHQQRYNGAGKVDLFIEGESGIYLIEMRAGERSQVYKVIKQ